MCLPLLAVRPRRTPNALPDPGHLVLSKPAREEKYKTWRYLLIPSSSSIVVRQMYPQRIRCLDPSVLFAFQSISCIQFVGSWPDNWISQLSFCPQLPSFDRCRRPRYCQCSATINQIPYYYFRCEHYSCTWTYNVSRLKQFSGIRYLTTTTSGSMFSF